MAGPVNASGIDEEAFVDYLSETLGLTGKPEIAPISGGQSNPTFFVTCEGRRLVLRKQPDGPLQKGAHAVDREFRVLSALAGTDVPVPGPVAYCDDKTILGTPFYLMERIEGRVFHEASLPGLSPQERHGIYLSMGEAMARLHAVRPDMIGLSDYGRPGNYFERQLARWGRQWHESGLSGMPEIDRLETWLLANLPEDDGAISIAHGDFRLGNLIFAHDSPKVVGILDWELSTLGHPLADLGFCCMAWRTLPQEYGGIRGLGLPALGIPPREEFVREYYNHARPTAALEPFHEAFALFRFAVIFVGIAERSRQGNAVGERAAELEHLAPAFARRGLELIA
ncbi:MAG: phosphotransferase family protein [Rhizobiaceae bacterium]|nr:phosphotransferase family protein [Rhizobiaceae bacterium]